MKSIAQGDAELAELGVGRQLGIENQLLEDIAPFGLSRTEQSGKRISSFWSPLRSYPWVSQKTRVAASCTRKARMPFCRGLRLEM